MSIYQGNKKVLGGVSNIEEDKVKEIADAEISSLVPTIKKNMLICPNGKSPKEFAIENSSNSQVVEFVQWGGTHSDSVAQYVTYKFIRGTDPNWGTLVAIINDTNYRRTIKYCGYDGYREDGAKWGDWINVNTTKVADVAKTAISPEASTATIQKGYYQVKNGICYVTIYNMLNTSIQRDVVILSNMPKNNSGVWSLLPLVNDSTGQIVGSVCIGGSSTTLMTHFFVANVPGSCHFSYPVAES